MSTNDVKAAIPRIHRHTLVEMNRPVFTARRDAAYARIAAILARDIQTGTREERAAWYQACFGLVEDALRCTERSQIAQDCPLAHYLRLLRDTLKALIAVVNHQITLVSETRTFTELLGKEAGARLEEAMGLFADSERQVLSSIHNLLQFGEPLRARDTEDRRQTFTEDDWRRFRHAAAEYGTLFGALGQ